MATRVGYIGLGAMGGGMARNLLKKGVDLTVFDVRANVRESFGALGAKVASSAAELAAQVDIVITSLPGSNEVRALYLGEDGIAGAMQPGSLAIDMSTIPPGVSREVAEQLAMRKVRMVDAPVARTKQAAEDGTLAIMVGGTDADFAEANPILRMMGTSITHVGQIGAGSIAKLVNNAVLMTNILVVSEGLSVGQQLGVDPGALAQVMTEGSADSFALRNHVIGSVLPGVFGEGRFPLSYAIKDIDYAMEAATTVDAVTPLLTQMSEFYHSVLGGELDSEYFPIAVQHLDTLNTSSIVGSTSNP